MNAREELFGREHELAALNAFVAAAGPRAIVLEGEPGIGKTSLWRSALEKAVDGGARVLSASPASGESQLSFSVLADLLGPTLDEVGEDLPAPQRRALALALLMEEAGDEETAQQRTVFAATLTTIRLLAERSPLLLAIDDMQWVDAASAGALGFAIRRLGDAPASIVGTKRSDLAPGTDNQIESAMESRHGQMMQVIEVGPLSMSSVHDAIRIRFGTTFPPSVMQRVHTTSGGNPFYALELARALTGRSAPLEPGGELPVPPTLQQVVGQRLSGLSDATQEALGLVALMSQPTYSTLEAAGVHAELAEALDAGIVERGDGDRLRFAHPLYASAAAARLTPETRRRLHARLAELLTGEERARHLALGAVGPSDAVARELDEAVKEAVGRGAIGTAAELAEQAIRLTPPERTDELRKRLLETATHEIRHGDTVAARAHLEPMLEQLPAGPLRAQVLLQLARLDEFQAAKALTLCEQAIAEAGPTDVTAAAAHQMAAEMSMLTGNIPAALEHARLACDTAEEAGDRSLLIESLGTLCHYQTYTGTIEPGLLERAVELERQHPRPSNNYSPREIMGLRLMYADRLDEARVLLEASLATAEEIGDELDRGSLLIHLTQLECRAGRLAVADEYAREVTISREQAGWGIAAARFVNALVGAHLGRVTKAREEAEDGAALSAAGGREVFRVLNTWARGFLELSRGDAPMADSYLRALPEIVDGMGYANPGVRPVHGDAIEARLGAGDVEVGSQVDDLERRANQFEHPTAKTVAARCRGLQLLASNRSDEAIAELDRALTLSQASPQPLERGRTELALGSALRRVKRRREAREHLTAALEIFDNLGTPLWAERAAAEIARIPGRSTNAASGLTPTEQRVAELVANGLSNKEVASKLFISVRTVEANLSSIYAKLGLRSRSELARRLGSEQPNS